MARTRCHGCGRELTLPGGAGRRDVCESCGAELHACVMCRHYEPDSARSCREPMAEPPREKDRSNFCDYFDLGAGPAAEVDRAAEARRAFDALFSKRQ